MTEKCCQYELFYHLFSCYKLRFLFLFDKKDIEKNPTDSPQCLFILIYPRGLPHSEQNFPLFTAPHLHTHSADGRGLPHSEQNLPAFV